jgi:hypothetical protein
MNAPRGTVYFILTKMILISLIKKPGDFVWSLYKRYL